MTDSLDPNYSGEGIYREHILDHYKNPHNYGSLEHADIVKREYNPLCGDEVTVYLQLDKTKCLLQDIKCMSKGCAISRSATSMLSDAIKGKPLAELKSLHRDVVLNLLHIPIGPVRMKCAVLSLVAIRNAIKEYEGDDEQFNN